jgi:hypothetical protein
MNSNSTLLNQVLVDDWIEYAGKNSLIIESKRGHVNYYELVEKRDYGVIPQK